MNYTSNHHLPQWIRSDRVRMDDFNAAMANIDAALTTAIAKADAAIAKADAAYSPENRSFVIGSYHGDGDESVQVKLGFKPSLVIISGIQECTSYEDTSDINRFFAITGDNKNVRNRVQITASGFTIYPIGTGGAYNPNLNVIGRTYDYIAFK